MRNQDQLDKKNLVRQHNQKRCRVLEDELLYSQYKDTEDFF